MLEILDTWAAWFAAIAAIAAVVAAAWTVRESRLAREAASRPYVTFRYWNTQKITDISKSKQTERWFVVLENHGATPALDVVVKPDASTIVWADIKQSKDLPFFGGDETSERFHNGLTVLAPGQKIFYHVGDQTFRELIRTTYSARKFSETPPLKFTVSYKAAPGVLRKPQIQEVQYASPADMFSSSSRVTSTATEDLEA